MSKTSATASYSQDIFSQLLTRAAQRMQTERVRVVECSAEMFDATGKAMGPLF